MTQTPPDTRRARRGARMPSARQGASATGPAPARAPGQAAGPIATSTRPVRARPMRRSFGPVPVAGLVGLQVLGVAVLLWPVATDLLRRVAVALLALVGLVLLVPIGAQTLAGAIGRRLSFVTRPRPAPPPVDARPVGLGLYPTVRLRTVRDHRGDVFGAAEWDQGVTAVVAVSYGRGPLLGPKRRPVVPVARLAARLAAASVPVDGLGIHTIVPGPPSAPPPPARWSARRDVLLSVRIRPLAARDAVARRGGARAGVEAALAAAVGLVAAEVRAAGLTAEVLDVEALRSALDLAASAGAPVLAGPDPAGVATAWGETWADATGPGVTERSLLLTAWAPHTIARLAAPQGGPVELTQALVAAVSGVSESVGLAVTLEIQPHWTTGRQSARVLVRVGAAGAAAAAAAEAAVRAAAAGVGASLSPVAGDQLAAARLGGLLGDGLGVVSPIAHPMRSTWLVLAPEQLDALAPSAGSWLPLGVEVEPALEAAAHAAEAGAGAAYGIDIVRARPQRIVTLGEGWVPAILVGRALRHGLPVLVVTDRPAPWQAIARAGTAAAPLTVVAPDARSLPLDGMPAARLVVLVGPIAAPGVRQPWQTTVHVLATPEADPGLLAGADLVLATAGAVPEGTRVAGWDGATVTRAAGLTGFEVACIEAGRVTVVAVDPDA